MFFGAGRGRVRHQRREGSGGYGGFGGGGGRAGSPRGPHGERRGAPLPGGGYADPPFAAFAHRAPGFGGAHERFPAGPDSVASSDYPDGYGGERGGGDGRSVGGSGATVSVAAFGEGFLARQRVHAERKRLKVHT